MCDTAQLAGHTHSLDSPPHARVAPIASESGEGPREHGELVEGLLAALCVGVVDGEEGISVKEPRVFVQSEGLEVVKTRHSQHLMQITHTSHHISRITQSMAHHGMAQHHTTHIHDVYCRVRDRLEIMNVT